MDRRHDVFVAAKTPASTPPEPRPILGGSAEEGRASFALFLAGFATFSLMYCVQPLLPEFARDFSVGPAVASLALSLTTGCLAISIVVAGAFSQALGRRGLMFASMGLAAALNLAAALSPDWHGLLIARALEGVVLGGVPAVAMAYIAEEIEPRRLGRSMGLYVAGTAFGAMVGRVGMGLLTEFTSWRMAMGVLGALCLLAAVGFFLLLPPSRNFVARPGLHPAYHLRTWAEQLRKPGLMRLFGIGFLLTSVFVALFNYATFRLSAAPYGLSQTAISMIFLTFGFGVVSSTVAGGLADRFGRRPLLVVGFATVLAGVCLTLFAPLPLIVGGIVLVTTGFFVAHSVASGSVGPLAGDAKGHAASLYLLFYYMGSSLTGSLGGIAWQQAGWGGVVALTGGLAAIGLCLALVRR